jgi:hypothetical protein
LSAQANSPQKTKDCGCNQQSENAQNETAQEENRASGATIAKVLILATSSCAQQFELDGSQELNHPVLPTAQL